MNIAIAVAASLLFLGLLLVKIVVSISTILVFVGMPLAVVVWPVVPWIARAAMRAFAVCLLVPVLWALCFAASAAVSLNAISFNAASVMNALLEPLVAIVLLWVMLRLPIHLAKVAMLGAAPLGGGFASRAVSYAAGSQLRDTAQAHLPSWAGGQTTQTATSKPAQAESRTGTRLRQAATLAGAAATGGRRVPARPRAARAAPAQRRSGGRVGRGDRHRCRHRRRTAAAYTPPPTAQANASGQAAAERVADPELRRPRAGLRQRDLRGAVPRAHQPRVAPSRPRPRSRACPADTQRGVGQLVSDHGAGAREHLAYQAMGEWSPEEREALRTLAAASPEIRAQARRRHERAEDGRAARTRSDEHRGRCAAQGPTVRAAADSPPPQASRATRPASGAQQPTGRPAASARPDSCHRTRLRPAREPRGPDPDELFPNG